MLRTLLNSVMGLCFAASATAADLPRERLNIMVILVDDLRWDELGCSGHPFVCTPHIDRIAAEGVRFRNAFCTTPLCSPARASVLSGQYALHHGIADNTNRSPQSHRMWTFPAQLQQAGYDTAFIGKWHMGNDDSARPGFDRWVCLRGQGTSFDPVLNIDGQRVEHRGHTTDVLNQLAVQFVQRQRQRPFCLYLSHKALHPEVVQRDDGTVSDTGASQFMPAPRHQSLYLDQAIPRRLNVTDDLRGKPALAQRLELRRQQNQTNGTSDQTVRQRLQMLAAVDEGVGQLLQALDDSGQLDNTVVVFTSDHGYWYSEHGLSVERRLAYEEGIRIPLLIRYPGSITAGQVVDQVALGIDLAPTLLELAGVPTDQAMDGRSLVPLLGGTPPDNWRRSFFIEYNSDIVFPHLQQMGYRAVRTTRWKYIQYRDISGMDELYDLQADPYEMTNLIDDPSWREVRGELSAAIDGFFIKPAR